MTQLELASRAAAGAMGMNPATEWGRARPVAEAVLAAIAGRETAEEVVSPTWGEYASYAARKGAEQADKEFASWFNAEAANQAAFNTGQARPAFQAVADLRASIDERTSPEIATIAARLMNHEDEDVRRVAASALVQR